MTVTGSAGERRAHSAARWSRSAFANARSILRGGSDCTARPSVVFAYCPCCRLYDGAILRTRVLECQQELAALVRSVTLTKRRAHGRDDSSPSDTECPDGFRAGAVGELQCRCHWRETESKKPVLPIPQWRRCKARQLEVFSACPAGAARIDSRRIAESSAARRSRWSGAARSASASHSLRRDTQYRGPRRFDHRTVPHFHQRWSRLAAIPRT